VTFTAICCHLRVLLFWVSCESFKVRLHVLNKLENLQQKPLNALMPILVELTKVLLFVCCCCSSFSSLTCLVILCGSSQAPEWRVRRAITKVVEIVARLFLFSLCRSFCCHDVLSESVHLPFACVCVYGGGFLSVNFANFCVCRLVSAECRNEGETSAAQLELLSDSLQVFLLALARSRSLPLYLRSSRDPPSPPMSFFPAPIVSRIYSFLKQDPVSDVRMAACEVVRSLVKTMSLKWVQKNVRYKLCRRSFDGRDKCC
jgi:hypothetical protein